MNKSKKIFKLLKKQGIINTKGLITMKMLGIEFSMDEKSALGDLIQEWLKNLAIQKQNLF